MLQFLASGSCSGLSGFHRRWLCRLSVSCHFVHINIKALIRISIIRIIRIFVFIWKASWYSNKYKQSKCTDLLLSVHPVWPISTNSIILAIKSVSWSGYSFVGLISDNPTKLINSSHIYVHERRVRILN